MPSLSLMDDDSLLDVVPSSCPRCGYGGVEYDPEYNALVHDHCGYWIDL